MKLLLAWIAQLAANRRARFLAAMAAVLVAFSFIGAPSRAQLQQAGGSGGSTNVAQVGGANIALGQANMAASFPVVIASNQSAVPASQSGTWNVGQTGTWTVGLNAGSNNVGKFTDNTTCGITVLAPAWAAVPTASTSVTSTTTCVEAIMFTNTNSSAQSVTVTDGQGTPVTVISAFSIPANSQVTFPFHGTPMTSGIKWSAGGTGITGSVKGYQ